MRDQEAELEKISRQQTGASSTVGVASGTSLPEVEFAEPNGLFEICRTPNDPQYDIQWGLFKISASKSIGSNEVIINMVSNLPKSTVGRIRAT